MANIAAYEEQLGQKLYDGLAARDRINIVGPPAAERGAALVAFTCDGVHSSDLAFFLDQEGVAVRAGHHCTQPLHKRLDADGGTVRASLALYNTEAEVAAFLAALDRVLADLADDSGFVPLDL
jgi:cysteine desulfurase/selenocysteine lyase